MTFLLLSLGVVAVIGVMLLLSRRGALTMARVRRSEAADGSASEAWLVDARDLAAHGASLLTDIGWPASLRSGALTDDGPAATDRKRPQARARLAELAHDSAVLTASAPTAMDARVCRNLGVRARALEAAIDDDTSGVAVKLEEFAVALRDMTDHVDLL